jgi:uncharacterized protein (DUF362 family)
MLPAAFVRMGTAGIMGRSQDAFVLHGASRMAGEEERGSLSRRGFLIGAAAVAAGLTGLRVMARRRHVVRLKEYAPNGLARGISIIHGDAKSPADEERVVTEMTRQAVAALGGMRTVVKKGDTVVIKPNMAWVWGPEMAANTNPYVVAALVRMCAEAGAARVCVMDNTIAADPSTSYRASGIAAAAAAAGAEVRYVERSRALTLPVPDHFVLPEWPFCREFVSGDACDVLINVPVLKDHGTSRLSIGLKNAFGMVAGERGQLHPEIHLKIPDLLRVIKVDLTVMDCYRVLRTHGPTGGTPADVDNSVQGARRVVASRDPVAVDACGASMFGYGPTQIGFIANAEKAGLGTADWHSLPLFEQTI